MKTTLLLFIIIAFGITVQSCQKELSPLSAYNPIADTIPVDTLPGDSTIIPDSLPPLAGGQPVDTLFFLGDSNDKGYGLTDLHKRLTTVLSKTMEAKEINRAVTGITMQDGSPKGYAGSYMTKFYLFPKFSPGGNNFVFVCVGTNDIRLGGNYSPAGYSAAYDIFLDTLINRNGFPPSKIVLATPPVMTDYGKGSNALQLIYNDTLQAISNRRGCRFYNLYQHLTDSTSLGLLQPDGIHLSETGHRVAAESYATLF